MIYSTLQQLDKDWAIDDSPQYWEGIIDDPSYYATWKDVEYCINNPQFFDLQFIDRISNVYIEYPIHERCWSRPKSFKVHEDCANNFIIQVEGQTHWRVYNNRCSNIVGKRFDYPEHDFLDCAIDVIMSPGDMLYIPARCYHQAQPHEKRLSVSIPMQHMYPHLKPMDRHYYEIN